VTRDSIVLNHSPKIGDIFTDWGHGYGDGPRLSTSSTPKNTRGKFTPNSFGDGLVDCNEPNRSGSQAETLLGGLDSDD